MSPTATPCTATLLAARDRREAATVWTALERRLETAGRPVPVAASWAWTDAWLRRFGDAVPHRFVVVHRIGGTAPRRPGHRRADDVVATALLTRSTGGARGLPVRRLHLGTAGEPADETVFVEYNDVLCAPADRRAACAAVAEALRAVPRWDELHLDGVAPATAAAFGAVLPLDERPAASWTVRLHPDRPVLDTLGGSTRRLLRQAVTALEPGEPERAASVPEALAMLDELAALHQRRWTGAGEPGAFASARRLGFVRDALAALLPSGRAAAFRLAGPDGTLGCAVGWVEDGRFLYYQGGFRQYDDVRKRAGLLCHVRFAECARGAGFTEYELLAGDAQYKRQLSAGERNTLVWARHRRPGWRTGVLDGARRLRDLRDTRRTPAEPVPAG